MRRLWRQNPLRALAQGVPKPRLRLSYLFENQTTYLPITFQDTTIIRAGTLMQLTNIYDNLMKLVLNKNRNESDHLRLLAK